MSEQNFDAPRPGIDELLIASALSPELRDRILEHPEEVFAEYDLTGEEREILLRQDHAMLSLLGAAIRRRTTSRQTAPAPVMTLPSIQTEALKEMSLVLTMVPCAEFEAGRLKISYAVWVTPLPDGVDPADLPPPAGTTLPGQPLLPLHAVLRVSAMRLEDSAGVPVVGLWASLLRSSNILVPPETVPRSTVEIHAAVDAIRSAAEGERYSRILDLIHALRAGGAQ